MLIGAIIGAIMTIVVSIVGEVRVMQEHRIQAEFLGTIENLSNEVKKKEEKHEELRVAMKDLIDASSELTHDYTIIAEILEKEIGKEEAWKRYEDKKSEEPKDINELFAEIKARKGE
jgi:hypothetical protein